jgi:hypothetical protein
MPYKHPERDRNYQHEYAIESPQRKKFRAQRNKARAIVEKANGKKNISAGSDVDHRVPLSQGGRTTLANLRVESAHANRTYDRTPSHAIAKKKKR